MSSLAMSLAILIINFILPSLSKKQVSPSRQRRRARRAAAQQAGAENVSTEEETVEEPVQNDNESKKRNSEARNVGKQKEMQMKSVILLNKSVKL